MTAVIRLAPGSTRNGLPEPRYVYRGTGEDTLTAFMDRRPARSKSPGLKTGPGRPRAPHGTVSAYRRHQRHGETPCDACRQAKNRAQAEYRKGGRSMSAADAREGLEAAIWHAFRHLRHPYVNPPGCVDEILAAADRYAEIAADERIAGRVAEHTVGRERLAEAVAEIARSAS